MNLKLIFVVLISIIAAFSLLYIVNYWYWSNYDKAGWEKEFYSQEFDPGKKKIFLVGSSFVNRINHTYVEKSLLDQGEVYDVYNLAQGYDLPERRIKSLDKIIYADPDIVVYGIGIRDLRGGEMSKFERELIIPNVIPTAKEESNELQFPFNHFYNLLQVKNTEEFFDVFRNPKFVTLNIFNIFAGEKMLTSLVNSTPKSPFELQHTLPQYGEKELNSTKLLLHFDHVDLHGNNAKSLESIIEELIKNDIEIIVLVTPHHSRYLEIIPNNEIADFNAFLTDIKNKHNIKIINLQEKYSELPIWTNWQHIVFHSNATLYYEDIAKGILEIEK